jgi:hypothetical protein
VDCGRRGHWASRGLVGARALGLAGGVQQKEGGHGELDGLLTGARAAVWRPGNSGEEQRRLELIARVKEGAKGARERGEKVW